MLIIIKGKPFSLFPLLHQRERGGLCNNQEGAINIDSEVFLKTICYASKNLATRFTSEKLFASFVVFETL